MKAQHRARFGQKVTMANLFEAIEKVMMGPEKKSRIY
jgi:ATP-dependent Zn protease